jgi:hypothetical protein
MAPLRIEPLGKRPILGGGTQEVRVPRSSLLLLLALSSLAVGHLQAAAAVDRIGVRAVETRLGLAVPEDEVGTTFLVSGTADLGCLAPALGLELGADFWSVSEGGSRAGSDVTYTCVAFLGAIRYEVPAGGAWYPYGTAGLSLSYNKVSWECADCPDWVDPSGSDMELGVVVGGGAEFGSGDIVPVGRLGLNINSGVDYFYISGGVRFPTGD